MPALAGDTAPPADLQRIHKEAASLIEADLPHAALELLAPLAESDPKNAVTLALLGEAFYAAEDTAPAIEHFERALRIDPALRGKLFHLGLAYHSVDRLSDAEEVFRALRAEEATTIQAKGAFGIGLVELSRGDEAAAEASFRAAIALDPNSWLARYRLALLLIPQDQLPAAEPELRAVIAANPRHHGALYNLALLLERTERHDESQALLGRYQTIFAAKQRLTTLYTQARLAKPDASLCAAIGEAHASLESWPQAIYWQRRAVSLAPGTTALELGLARALARAARDRDAEAVYRAVLAREPSCGDAARELAEILDARGDTNGAREVRERAKEAAKTSDK